MANNTALHLSADMLWNMPVSWLDEMYASPFNFVGLKDKRPSKGWRKHCRKVKALKPKLVTCTTSWEIPNPEPVKTYFEPKFYFAPKMG